MGSTFVFDLVDNLSQFQQSCLSQLYSIDARR